MTTWRALYASFLTAYVGLDMPSFPALDAVNTTISNLETNQNAIPIALLHANYNDLRPDAIGAGLMSISNEQLFDVAGRTQSPYRNQTLFAAAPALSYSDNEVTRFVFDNSLVFKNTGSLNSIEVDFADGLGYRTVTLGSVFNISWATVGDYRIKVRVTPAVGSVVESWFDFTVNKASNIGSRYDANNRFLLADPTFLPSANHSGGRINVILSVNNTSGRIRKPLIVAEGFDANSIAPKLVGNYNINDFIESLPLNFNDNLDDIASYDLIFIDYNNGADDIRRNAALLQAVVRRVNIEKALGGSTEQNVIMGLSMGGLVARFGLAQMVRNGENTQTRLLITHDSPHRGANVPLAFQFIARQITNLGSFGVGIPGSRFVINIHPTDLIDRPRQLRNLLNAPASSQLLINRATGAQTSSVVSNTFLADGGEYRTMVDNLNAPYEIIATSNGSQCGVPLFQPNTDLLKGDVGGYLGAQFLLSTGFRTSFTFKSAANQAVNEAVNWRVYSQTRIFTIPINITLYRYTVNSPAIIPFDGVAGGTFATDVETTEKEQWWFPVLGYSLSITGVRAFCFVPVGSALDVSNLNTSLSERYVGSVNISNPSKFNRYIGQETVQRNIGGVIVSIQNERHIRFTGRNSRWLFDQMENPTNTSNQECTNECSSSGFSISGDNLVCSSATYTVNAPVGTPVTWSVTPSNIASLTSNGNSATLTKITDGTVTLIARLGNCTSVFYQPIYIGAPPTQAIFYPVDIAVGNPQPIPDGFNGTIPVYQPGNIEINGGGGNVTFSVIASSGYVSWSAISGNVLAFYFSSPGDYATFAATVSTPCGDVTTTYTYTAVAQGWFFRLSPNPASDVVILKAEKSKNSPSNTASQESDSESDLQFDVNIYDQSNRMVKQMKNGKGVSEMKINVLDLPSNQYYSVQVIHKKKVSSLRFFKN